MLCGDMRKNTASKACLFPLCVSKPWARLRKVVWWAVALFLYVTAALSILRARPVFSRACIVVQQSSSPILVVLFKLGCVQPVVFVVPPACLKRG